MTWLEASRRKREVVDRFHGKRSRDEVNYRPQRDSESVKSCFDCQYYTDEGEPQSACEKVAGMVEAEDICDLWEARTSEGAQPSIEIKVKM